MHIAGLCNSAASACFFNEKRIFFFPPSQVFVLAVFSFPLNAPGSWVFVTSVGKDSQDAVSTAALKHKTSVLGSAGVGSMSQSEMSFCLLQTVHEGRRSMWPFHDNVVLYCKYFLQACIRFFVRSSLYHMLFLHTWWTHKTCTITYEFHSDLLQTELLWVWMYFSRFFSHLRLFKDTVSVHVLL